MLRPVAIVVCLAGCHELFNLEGLRGDARTGDATDATDDATSPCNSHSFSSLGGWTPSASGGCTAMPVNGKAELRIPTNSQCRVTIETTTPSVSAATITVKVDSVGNQQGDLQTFFEVHADGERYMFFTVLDGYMYMVAHYDGADMQEGGTMYQPELMPYWQFRRIPSTSRFEMFTGTGSADGWTRHHELDVTFADEPMTVILGSSRYTTDPESVAQFDHFELCPP